MVLSPLQEKYMNRENNFYRINFHYFLYAMLSMVAIIIVIISVLLYQVINRPIPPFTAVDPKAQTTELQPFSEPSVLPDTIIRFACKAAVLAYTFDFSGYDQQLEQARPYFTEAGWQSFRGAINPVIQKIVQAKLFVNGVVVGTPVISNQGELPGKGYVWRVQIPFVGSYSNGETENHRNFYVIVSIVKVPTSDNPQGMGIDQFVMTG